MAPPGLGFEALTGPFVRISKNNQPHATVALPAFPSMLPAILPTAAAQYVSGVGPAPNLYKDSLNAGVAAYDNPQLQTLDPSLNTANDQANIAAVERDWLLHRDALYFAIRTPPQDPSEAQTNSLISFETFVKKINGDPADQKWVTYDPHRADELLLATAATILTTIIETTKSGHGLRGDQLFSLINGYQKQAKSDMELKINDRIDLVAQGLQQDKHLVVDCVQSKTKIRVLVCGPGRVTEIMQNSYKSAKTAQARNKNNPESKKKGPRTPIQ